MRWDYLKILTAPGRIPTLDGLRGIAITLVLVRHAVRPVLDEDGSLLQIGGWDLAIPFLNGWMGVDLFFVLSGFLITYHLLIRWPETFSLSFALRYWSKRILRTFPAFYAAVAIAMLGIIPLFAPSFDDYRFTLSVHILFLQDYLGSELVPAFWSLGVEEKFYIVCPFVLIAVNRLRLTPRIIALALLAFLPLLLRIVTLQSNADLINNYESFFWIARSPFHLAMDGLWVGVLCAMLYKSGLPVFRNNDRLASRMCNASLAVLIVAAFWSAWFDELRYVESAIVLNVIAIAFGGLLLSVCVGETAISGVLRSKTLRLMSVLAYSVYLVHLMLEPLSIAIAESLFSISHLSPIQAFLIFLPLFLAVSLIGGAILHLTVEKPFLILKDRIRLEDRN